MSGDCLNHKNKLLCVHAARQTNQPSFYNIDLAFWSNVTTVGCHISSQVYFAIPYVKSMQEGSSERPCGHLRQLYQIVVFKQYK